jgi:excisionase family DNA binding protein
MTIIPSTQKDILRTREAAAMLKVTTQTIKNYIYSGRLKALKTPGGHHRIRKSDLKELGFLDDVPGEEGTLSREELYRLYQDLLNSYSATIKVPNDWVYPLRKEEILTLLHFYMTWVRLG